MTLICDPVLLWKFHYSSCHDPSTRPKSQFCKRLAERLAAVLQKGLQNPRNVVFPMGRSSIKMDVSNVAFLIGRMSIEMYGFLAGLFAILLSIKGTRKLWGSLD